MTEKLKPCPFCGSEDVELVSFGAKTVSYQVKCNTCEAYGPLFYNGNEAASRAALFWNTRPSPKSESEK